MVSKSSKVGEEVNLMEEKKGLDILREKKDDKILKIRDIADVGNLTDEQISELFEKNIKSAREDMQKLFGE